MVREGAGYERRESGDELVRHGRERQQGKHGEPRQWQGGAYTSIMQCGTHVQCKENKRQKSRKVRCHKVDRDGMTVRVATQGNAQHDTRGTTGEARLMRLGRQARSEQH